jgi:hypothetical protein
MKPASRRYRDVALFATALLLANPVRAQLPVARLDTVFPPGARIGSTTEVATAGAELDEIRRLHFSHPGIEARQVGGAGSSRFAVSISTNVTPGNYEVRVSGLFGVSNPRVFSVGDLAEYLDPATNSTLAAAAPATLGTTINGQVTAARSDYFRFVLQAGQRVLLQCSSAVLDSKLDPVFLLYSGDGKELARNRRRGVLDWTAKLSGDYVVRIHDAINRGGSEFFYRLSLSEAPYIDSVVPSSVEPGTNRVITLLGRNLPGGSPVPDRKVDGKPLEKLEVTVNPDAPEWVGQRLASSLRFGAAAASVDAFDYRLGSTNGVSNPVLLSRASYPVQLEQEPNDVASKAQTISIPTELSGEFGGRTDADWYSFQAKKGETWVAEILSQRLGSPTDPALHLLRVAKDKKGGEELSDVGEGYDTDPGLGGVDFKAQSGDPTLRFEVKEDGWYRLMVRDQARVPRDDLFRSYRLVIRPSTPDYRLVAMPQTPPPVAKDSKEIKTWSSVLRKGGVLALRIMAFRFDGMDQDIQVSVEGLPAGVTSRGARLLGADGRSTTLLLQADETAASWVGPIRIVGKATTKQGELVRAARSASVVWGVSSYETEAVQTRVTETLTLAVSGEDIAPLGLLLGDQKPIEAAVNSKVSLPAKLVRRAEFPGNSKLRLVGHPALGAGKEIEVDKAATNAVFELDLAQLKMPEGDHWLYLETQTAFKLERSAEGARKAEAAKVEAEKAAVRAKEASDKAKAALVEATKALEKAEADAKASPEKQAALKSYQDTKAAVTKLAEESAKALEQADKAKAASVEQVKQFAKRDYTDTFYSMPLLLRVSAPKTAQTQPSKP